MGDRKRRFWSDEEKRSICRQASLPEVSVAQVAQRHAMNANLVFKWLRDPRFAPATQDGPGSIFLPVEISRHGPGDTAPVEAMEPQALSCGGRVQIELAGGHRIVAEEGFDPDALGRLLKSWLS